MTLIPATVSSPANCMPAAPCTRLGDVRGNRAVLVRAQPPEESSELCRREIFRGQETFPLAPFTVADQPASMLRAGGCCRFPARRLQRRGGRPSGARDRGAVGSARITPPSDQFEGDIVIRDRRPPERRTTIESAMTDDPGLSELRIQRLDQCGHQRLHVKGFDDDCHVAVMGPSQYSRVTQCCHQDNGDGGGPLADGLDDLPAAPIGHGEVGEHEIPASLVEATGSAPAIGGLAIIPKRREDGADDLP
jgi:hypothetical protein